MKFSPFKRKSNGMTLVEVLIVMAILAILASISSFVYLGYVDRAKMYAAINSISMLSTELTSYGMDTGVYPQSLAAIGRDGPVDPWGNTFEYVNIMNGGANIKSKARKDKFLVPINSDFDLYSKGPNGESVPSLNAKKSKDDIIRANDGQYIGLAGGF